MGTLEKDIFEDFTFFSSDNLYGTSNAKSLIISSSSSITGNL